MLAEAQRDIAAPPFKPRPGDWSENEITICWLGHATALINFFGVHILTDPAFSKRIGISWGLGVAGPKRHFAPALDISELPPIDVVLLSHAHMDHMDLPSLAGFGASTVVATAKKTRDILAGSRSPIAELSWGEQRSVRCPNGEIAIEAFEVKHWGQRWPSEIVRGYNGYVLRREGKTLLFGGDTAHTPLFRNLRSGGPFEAAIMPIGAYRPWIRNHCTPEEAVSMANEAGARYIVPVHHQTFRLSDEPFKEPIERLELALEDEPERLALRQVGEAFVCPAA